MLDHIDGSQMTEAEKAHWRSVGYFFRSYRYFHCYATMVVYLGLTMY